MLKLFEEEFLQQEPPCKFACVQKRFDFCSTGLNNLPQRKHPLGDLGCDSLSDAPPGLQQHLWGTHLHLTSQVLLSFLLQSFFFLHFLLFHSLHTCLGQCKSSPTWGCRLRGRGGAREGPWAWAMPGTSCCCCMALGRCCSTRLHSTHTAHHHSLFTLRQACCRHESTSWGKACSVHMFILHLSLDIALLKLHSS